MPSGLPTRAYVSNSYDYAYACISSQDRVLDELYPLGCIGQLHRSLLLVVWKYCKISSLVFVILLDT